ncbi:conidial development protein fluffy [Fusarium austroafricanum]|uniref:Conidial development protein fluffy n=1 Tax=Fusarium austroafricanum TaxID=2364996 RepID=A0A8H4KW22_9HYPO|nr:conidial development protein fluffy [Fusarium austroafricanum]
MGSDASEEYFSVSTIAVNPDRVGEAHACLTEVAEATLKEPGAKIYRFFKSEGKDEFVCMEKFTNREAYAAHVNSEHVRDWVNKYLDSGIFVGSFEFHNLAKEGPGAGGFDRP